MSTNDEPHFTAPRRIEAPGQTGIFGDSANATTTESGGDVADRLKASADEHNAKIAERRRAYREAQERADAAAIADGRQPAPPLTGSPPDPVPVETGLPDPPAEPAPPEPDPVPHPDVPVPGPPTPDEAADLHPDPEPTPPAPASDRLIPEADLPAERPETDEERRRRSPVYRVEEEVAVVRLRDLSEGDGGNHTFSPDQVVNAWVLLDAELAAPTQEQAIEIATANTGGIRGGTFSVTRAQSVTVHTPKVRPVLDFNPEESA